MSDIIKELREQAKYLVVYNPNVGEDVPALWIRAADEIERLRAALDRMNRSIAAARK